MASKSATVKNKKTTPHFENPSPELKTFKSEKIWGEIPGDRLVVHWDKKVHQEVNYLDEDLFLRILNPDDNSVYQEFRVNYLEEKEVNLQPGNVYLVQLAIKERFRVSVATTSEYTPRVTFIPEGIDRYMLTWGKLEWEHIKREVTREHNVNWEKDIDVALRITRWEATGEAPLEEWRFPGMRDMEIIGGKIKDVYLLVVRSEDKTQLKEVFKIRVEPGEVKKSIDEMVITTPEMKPYFYLYREVHETDSTHLRTFWEIPAPMWEKVANSMKKKDLSQYHIVLKLYIKTPEGPVEYRPEIEKRVFGEGDWFFGNVLNDSVYFAKLVLVNSKTGREQKKPLMVSNEFYVPKKDNEVVLLPIDESRIFAYWHLNRAKVWRDLVEKHDAKSDNVKYFIKIFHDYAGGMFHQPHLDAEFHMDHTDNYYLHVDPDKVYRAQLIAVVDGWKVEELTPLSNPVQTMRTHTGNNPVSYVDFPQPQDHPTNRKIESNMDTDQWAIGKLIIHLHAHLPFVGKRINYGTSGYWRPGGYIEEWFHEAVRSTYIPLISSFESLIEEGIDFKISMDISPPLTNMMRSTLLQEEFLNYIDSLISLAKTEVERTAREEPWYNTAARMHLSDFRKAKSIFLKYDKDLTRAFKKFQDMGKIEISTCAATHGYLPLIGSKYIEAIRGQVKTAVIDYMNTFGRQPYGIWLPECAYAPGIEAVLEEFGLRYFFTETHTLLHGDSHVEFGVHAPCYVKGSQIAAFARDPETGKQVWSGDEGYPGDPDYLEFHLRGGPLKYNRITDRRGSYKQPYVPEWAESKASAHAQHFMQNRNFRFEYIKNWFWKKPLVVATYDAELFGHHWYEGPKFLYYLLKKMYYDQNQTELTTPSHYLAEHSYNQEIFPTPSSWGDKGTFDKWMYGSVSWMYRHMNDACSEMINLATWAKEKNMHVENDEIGIRILSQMARYLLLAQNSDHGFNISNGHFVDRIKGLFFEDLNNFWSLANMFVTYMNQGYYNEVQLRKMERDLHIFPEIDPFVWARG